MAASGGCIGAGTPRPMTHPNPTLAPAIAWIIPALNEADNLPALVDMIGRLTPDAAIHLCDNGSTDNTAAIARSLGVTVWNEPRRGKSRAVRKLIQCVDAGVYVLCDADCTYQPDPETFREALARMQSENLDLMTGERDPVGNALRRVNRWGNALFSWGLHLIFPNVTRDVLSGFRVMSRRFAHAIPHTFNGFEIEAEMHALASMGPYACDSFPIPYYSRTGTCTSKLNVLADGIRILYAVAILMLTWRPGLVVAIPGFLMKAVATVWGGMMAWEFIADGQIPQLAALIIVSAMGLGGMIMGIAGMILGSLTRLRVEALRLA